MTSMTTTYEPTARQVKFVNRLSTISSGPLRSNPPSLFSRTRPSRGSWTRTDPRPGRTSTTSSARASMAAARRHACGYGWELIKFGALIQPGAAEAVEIVLAVGVVLDRHIAPRSRRARCSAARGAAPAARLSRVSCLAGHARGGGEHPVGADEIAALAQRLARQPHRLVIIASEELGVGGDADIDRRKRIARAQSQRAAGGLVALLPAAAVGTAPGRR